jgi:filamentous hemagglutinin family protein
MRNCLIILFGLWIMLKTDVNADVVTDGSLGDRVTLTGQTLSIPPTLGQQVGDRLFHSFQEFNLNAQQTAIFSGSHEIHTIVSRVTGTQPSFIDGTIRSTLPNANLYLLNPQGIIFGEHAQLDVSGSFFASTADSLHFQDGSQFSAQSPQNSVLSVAPVESFGFLRNSPAAIQVRDSHLSVSEGKTLSLIGGDLHFTGKLVSDPRTSPRIYNPPIDTLVFPNYSTKITAAAGMVQLISVSAPGKIDPLIANRQLEQGAINLNQAHISTTGLRGGDISIRSGLLHLHDAQIDSQTLGELTGGDIAIQATDIVLHGEQDFSAIVMNTQGIGQGGNVRITADNLHIFGGGLILNGCYGTGHSGDTEIHLNHQLAVDGKYLSQFLLPSGIISAAYATKEISGNGGNISVIAKDIRLSGGGEIAVSTYGGGHSGNIKITTETFTAHGLEKTTVYDEATQQDNNWFAQSGVVSNSQAGSGYLEAFRIPRINRAGNAGNIEIFATDMTLYDSGLIVSDGTQGNAGTIDIHTQRLTLADMGLIGGSTWGEGRGGVINVNVSNELTISNQYQSSKVPSGIFSDSLGDKEYAGDGGNIMIRAGRITISGYSTITTETKNASGGNIEIISPRLLVEGAKISTSVSGGKGNGGDIVVLDSQIVILNGATLTTQALEGKGGNIRVAAGRFISSPDSVISASSLVGDDGNISINSPIQEVTNDLFTLPSNFLDAGKLLKEPCYSRGRRNADSLNLLNSENKLQLLPKPLLRISSTSLKRLRAAPSEWYPQF